MWQRTDNHYIKLETSFEQLVLDLPSDSWNTRLNLSAHSHDYYT
jgi:hypothetical protein